MLITKKWKRQTIEGIELSNQGSIRTVKEKASSWNYWKWIPPNKKR